MDQDEMSAEDKALNATLSPTITRLVEAVNGVRPDEAIMAIIAVTADIISSTALCAARQDRFARSVGKEIRDNTARRRRLLAADTLAAGKAAAAAKPRSPDDAMETLETLHALAGGTITTLTNPETGKSVPVLFLAAAEPESLIE